MQVGVSGAEDRVHMELQRRGLVDRMLPRGSTILFDADNGYVIVKPEWVTRKMIREAVCWTVPDVPFPTFLSYLDGEVHLTRGARNRDDRINGFLDAVGLRFGRFPYRGRLSHVRLLEIADVIVEALLVGKKKVTP